MLLLMAIAIYLIIRIFTIDRASTGINIFKLKSLLLLCNLDAY